MLNVSLIGDLAPPTAILDSDRLL